MIKKLRIFISRIVAGIIFFLICVSGSIWEDSASMAPTVLFLLGAVFVGIATLGRLWCALYIAGYKNHCHGRSETAIKQPV